MIRTAAVEVDLPEGAVPTGERFEVRVGDPVGGVEGYGLHSMFGAPVGVEHSAGVAEPIHISWDVSHLSDEQRSGLVLVRWDEDLGVWRAAAETAVLTGSVLEAELTQFSWLNWISPGAARISQSVGEMMGQRSGHRPARTHRCPVGSETSCAQTPRNLPRRFVPAWSRTRMTCSRCAQ